MDRINFRKRLRHLYGATTKAVASVDVPEMNFLLIDGEGDPNTTRAFGEAIETLYAVSYTLKFMIRRSAQGIDYGVMPLEGLWWADDLSTFAFNRRDAWKWTLMIMQPEPVTRDLVAEAREQVGKKRNPAALPLLRCEAFREGAAAQTLHVGPFAEEGPTIQRLHRFIQDAGGTLVGKHHEIYLNDFRRAAPERWKTIIRQPLRTGPPGS